MLEVIVRDVGRLDAYPEGDDSFRNRVSPWFRAGIVGLYDGGLEIAGRAITGVVANGVAIPTEDGELLFPGGLVSYDKIVALDWDPDGHYSAPLLVRARGRPLRIEGHAGLPLPPGRRLVRATRRSEAEEGTAVAASMVAGLAAASKDHQGQSRVRRACSQGADPDAELTSSTSGSLLPNTGQWASLPMRQ
jgi:hypothetical protein